MDISRWNRCSISTKRVIVGKNREISNEQSCGLRKVNPCQIHGQVVLEPHRMTQLKQTSGHNKNHTAWNLQITLLFYTTDGAFPAICRAQFISQEPPITEQLALDSSLSIRNGHGWSEAITNLDVWRWNLSRCTSQNVRENLTLSLQTLINCQLLQENS